MIHFSLLAIVTLLAYFVKGLTGFGPAIVFISLGSLILPPTMIVTVSPFLDVLAGAILLVKDRSHSMISYWVRLAAPILIGVILGATGLRFASDRLYSCLLGIAILTLGLWFVTRRPAIAPDNTPVPIPRKPGPGAVATSIVSGITGGFFGISGPPLIWYFGRRYPKSVFRKIIVPLFLIEASGRSVIYVSLGMLGTRHWTLMALLIPTLLAGLLLGNHWFNRVPQERFERIIGWVLAASGIRLIIG